MSPVYTPVRMQGDDKKVQIGAYAMLTPKEAAEAVESAAKAWDNGRGTWAQATAVERIAAMEKFVDGMRGVRDRIVELLMWEICKNGGCLKFGVPLCGLTIRYSKGCGRGG